MVSDTHSTAYTEPASRWENGFAEAFNGRFRNQLLNIELIVTAPEDHLLADCRRWEYYFLRPQPVLKGADFLSDISTGNCRKTTATLSRKA
jgi:putative transposase